MAAADAPARSGLGGGGLCNGRRHSDDLHEEAYRHDDCGEEEPGGLVADRVGEVAERGRSDESAAGTCTLPAGVIALRGPIAIIHGINYRFPFDRGSTIGLRTVFFAAGIVAMVHPDRIVQLGALALVIVLYGV